MLHLKLNSEKEIKPRLAVLIDADNAQLNSIDGLISEISKYGEITLKRIYGDFTSPTNSSWKKILHKHSIKPIHQFSYVSGKNSTDISLIIDSMDLLYTQKFDGFCLVTSDSDFTGLAIRLREQGLIVLGFGEKSTPESFQNACNKFLFIENFHPNKLNKIDIQDKNINNDTKNIENIDKAIKNVDSIKNILLEAFNKSIDNSGWAHLGSFGNCLKQIQPDFNCKNYGFKKLSDLIKFNHDLFLIEEKQDKKSNQKSLYFKLK